MLEGYLWLAEGAAVAGPTVAGAAYVLGARGHRRKWLREPILWDGGQPVSLVTIFGEFNGQPDMAGALREVVGGQGPLSGRDLERAVRQLQGHPTLVNQLLLHLATDVLVMETLPVGRAADGSLSLMERLTEASSRMGFFEFTAHLNTLRPTTAPPLLPVEGLLAGGLPLLGGNEAPDPELRGSGVLAAISALRNVGQDGWLPSVARAVEELVKDWRIKKARDQLQKAYYAAGVLLMDAARQRSPLWGQVRRNVYAPLDAYRTLEARARARRDESRGMKGLVVPSVETVLWTDYGASLARATRLVQDKCASLERILAGQYGPAASGEVLYRHRHVLTAGVAPDAFPFPAIEQAKQELVKAHEEAGQAS